MATVSHLPPQVITTISATATITSMPNNTHNNNAPEMATTTGTEALGRPRRNLHRRTRSTNSVDPALLAELRASKEVPGDFLEELTKKRASVVSLPSMPNSRRSLDERPLNLLSEDLSVDKPSVTLFNNFSLPSRASSDTPRGMMLIPPSQPSPHFSLTSAATATTPRTTAEADGMSPPTSLRLPPAIPNNSFTRLPFRGRKLRLDPINNCVRLNNIEGEIRLRSPVMEVDESDLEDDFSTFNESIAPLDDQEVCSLASDSQRSSRDSSMLPSPSPSQPYLPICPPISHPQLAHHAANNREDKMGVPIKEDDLSLAGIGIGIGIDIDTSSYTGMNKAVDEPLNIDYRKTQVIERPARSTNGLRWDIWRLCWQA